MIGLSPAVAGVHAAPEKRESETDFALGQLADAVDRVERNGVTDGQWDRARELLRRLKAAINGEES